MSYNKRRPFEDGCPDGYLESDKDYLLNNLELAVKLLNEYGSGVNSQTHPDEVPEITDRNHCMNIKPDFSGEDREYLNKYGPKLKDIEDKMKEDDWLDDYGWREEANRNDDS